jgi:hypothetical protein
VLHDAADDVALQAGAVVLGIGIDDHNPAAPALIGKSDPAAAARRSRVVSAAR